MEELSENDIKYISRKFPHPYNVPERFREYILPKIQEHRTLCTATIAEMRILLLPLIKRYCHRFFCRIDDTNLLKTPESIIDKLRRSQKEDRKPGPAVDAFSTPDNFHRTMTDLARFRIVCNFICDVKLVAKTIKNADKINLLFNLHSAKDSIDLRPKERKSGERSIKFVLEYKTSSGLFLEIQIMTQLAEAWDKKDHFLVYETRRLEPDKDEIYFPDYLDAKVSAMSDLLYIADSYFDELRSTRENVNHRQEES